MRFYSNTMHFIAILLLMTTYSAAQAAKPDIKWLHPAGGQIGKTIEVTLDKNHVTPVLSVWSNRSGLKFTFPKKTEKNKQKQVTMQIDTNAKPGLYWLRFFNTEGASGLRPFIVGTLPEQNEVEPNDEITKAHHCKTSKVVVNGLLSKSGDVDVFRVELKKGETFIASQVAYEKLGSPMDAVLQLLSSRGIVITQNDDTIGIDPRIVYQVKETGTYYLRTFAFPATPNSSIRFAGSSSYIYRLTMTTGPFVDHTIPLVASQKGGLPIKLAGWNITKKLQQLSPQINNQKTRATIGHHELANTLTIPVTSHAAQIETSAAQQKGQLLTLPGSVTGKISQAKERDIYRFRAKKGDKFSFKVISHALDYPLDSHLSLHNSQDKLLRENDDNARNMFDAKLDYSFTKDGEYFLKITDRFRHGGFRYVYCLDIQPTGNHFKLNVVKDRYTILKGKAIEIDVTINRFKSSFGEEIEISLVGLPKGVTCKKMISKMKSKTEKKIKLKIEAKPNISFQGPINIQGISLGKSNTKETATTVLTGVGLATTTARPAPPRQTNHLWLTIISSASSK